MCKSLILLKSKMYREEDKPSYKYTAKVANISDEEISSLPIFVELSLVCNSEECDNIVEATMCIKTTRKIKKIINRIVNQPESVDIDNIQCPICGNNMVISCIETIYDDEE